MTNCIPSSGTRISVARTAFMYMLDSARCVSLSLVTSTLMMFSKKKRFTCRDRAKKPKQHKSYRCFSSCLEKNPLISCQTHEKRRHYGPVDGVEQMGVYAHPTATTGWGGRNTSVSSVQNTHHHTRTQRQTRPVCFQKSPPHYSLVVEVLFPRHGVDGRGHQGEAFGRERGGRRMRS